jgi:type I restriction enzyme M protein
MFVQHMVAVLRAGGMVCTVMPHGVLFRGGAERDIRTGFMNDDLLDAVIGLAPNLFYGTGIPACILVLRAKGRSPRARGQGAVHQRRPRVQRGPGAELPGARAHREDRQAWHAFEDIDGFARRGDPRGAEGERRQPQHPPLRRQRPAARAPRRARAPARRHPEGRGRGEAAGCSRRTGSTRGACWKKHKKVLAELPETQELMKARASLLGSFEKAVGPVGLLDRFQVAGVVATWWGDVQNDLRTITARGFLGLVEAWETSILTALEDGKSKENPLEHRLVKRLLPSTWRRSPSWRRRRRSWRRRSRAPVAGGEEEGEEAEESEDQLSEEELAALKKQLATTKKALKAKQDDFAHKLKEARRALLEPGARDLVLGILRRIWMRSLGGTWRATGRRWSAAFESWWDKYRVTLTSIEEERDAAAEKLRGFLGGWVCELSSWSRYPITGRGRRHHRRASSHVSRGTAHRWGQRSTRHRQHVHAANSECHFDGLDIRDVAYMDRVPTRAWRAATFFCGRTPEHHGTSIGRCACTLGEARTS